MAEAAGDGWKGHVRLAPDSPRIAASYRICTVARGVKSSAVLTGLTFLDLPYVTSGVCPIRAPRMVKSGKE